MILVQCHPRICSLQEQKLELEDSCNIFFSQLLHVKETTEAEKPTLIIPGFPLLSW